MGTGLLGYMGNKGAVGVRLRVHDSGLAFVNAHLASGEGEGDDARRNADYAVSAGVGLLLLLLGAVLFCCRALLCCIVVGVGVGGG